MKMNSTSADDDLESESLLSTNNQRDDDLETKPLRLKVRTTTNVNALEVTVPPNSTILTLKTLVMKAIKETKTTISHDQTLRLISAGKILGPDGKDVKDFNIQEGGFVHAVFSKNSNSSNNNTNNATTVPTPDTSFGIPNRGFDSLRAITSLTQEDITALREYFSPEVSAHVTTSSSQRREGESAVEFQMRMEEEWMSRQGPGTDFQINVNSQALAASTRSPFGDLEMGAFRRADFTTGGEVPQVMGPPRDFFLGFFLGFVIGFFALFWVWMPYTTHRKKIGILTGITIQIFFSVSNQAATADFGHF